MNGSPCLDSVCSPIRVTNLKDQPEKHMHNRRDSKSWLGFVLLGVAALMVVGSAQKAGADCSVIAPEGFDQRAFLGSATSPFLTPGLTNDIKVLSALCDLEQDSAAADFRVGGMDLPVDDFVITIAFVAAGSPPLVVLSSDETVCGGDSNCSVEPDSDREIVEIPLPGGSVERRLRFRVPEIHFFGISPILQKFQADENQILQTGM
jgi:hypothetical protein